MLTFSKGDRSVVMGAGGTTSSADIITGAPADSAAFVSRFEGAAGDGTITVIQNETPATVRTMNAAPEGTMLVTRTGGGPVKKKWNKMNWPTWITARFHTMVF